MIVGFIHSCIIIRRVTEYLQAQTHAKENPAAEFSKSEPKGPSEMLAWTS